MKVLEINTVYGIGSTGKIVEQIMNVCKIYEHECLVAHRYEEANCVYDINTFPISSWLDCHIHNRLVRYTGLQGYFSKRKTKAFIREIRKIKPDIIHLHNIHGSYLNLKLLFSFIKESNISVIWTLHDCWSFTGHCYYFDMSACDKWKKKCHQCPQYNISPKSYIDTSKYMYQLKKNFFTGADITIVTPSRWLADLTKESFLKDYPVKVINNGINLDIFKPIKSDFRIKYGCEDKIVLLGVAFGWGKRKGLDLFIELSKKLPENYQIILVGTDDSIDKFLPNNIISIHRTQNQKELAEIYTAADLFINPTREDNYPTVNMEALACGTPVLTFDTGGSAEMLSSECGKVIEKNDFVTLEKEVIRICEDKLYSQDACLKRAKQFDMNSCFIEYIHLYEEVFNERAAKKRI